MEMGNRPGLSGRRIGRPMNAKESLARGQPGWVDVHPQVDHAQLCKLVVACSPRSRRPCALARPFEEEEAEALRDLGCAYYDLCLDEARRHSCRGNGAYPTIRDMVTWFCHPTCPHRSRSRSRRQQIK